MLIQTTSSRARWLLWTFILFAQSTLTIQTHAAENQQPVAVAITPAEGITLHFQRAVAALYQKQPGQLFWRDSATVNAFEQQLAILALSGVDLRYNQWLTAISRPDLNEKDRDWVLTDALLGYLGFVATVPVNGELLLYGKANLADSPPPNEIIERWQNAITHQATLAFITSLQPQHPQYRMLEKALKQLLAQPDIELKLSNTLPTLRMGQKSEQVPILRGILLNGGWLANPPLESTAPVDNTFSPELVEAVKRFQQWQGLNPDGIIGPETRLWLNTPPQQRAAILALNMQRLRLLPDDINNGIMVNIADYSLNYFVNGKQILSSKVIVGRKNRRTPLMKSALNSVVINPPWNVPTNLVWQDIIPKIQQDSGYLQQHGYTILSNWSPNPEVIDPSTIDWNGVNPKTFSYRIQQSAGPLSSLGRYKFNMPTSSAIYLHDTPNHTLFERESRALSSGCIRVDKAAELAQILLSNAGWDSNRLNETVQQQITRYVAIRQHIPVNLFYVTAFTNEAGKLIFRTDIYGYDTLAKRGLATINVARKYI